MNTIGIALVWCIVQVTLLGLLASGLYLLVRRLRPAAAMLVVLTGLIVVVMLSLLALSPWPRWATGGPTPSSDQWLRTSQPSADDFAEDPRELSNNLPLPLKQGQTVKADTSPLPPEERQGVRAADRSMLVHLWQALEEELSQPQATASATAWRWPAAVAALLLAAVAGGLGWLLLGVFALRRQRLCSRPVVDGQLLEVVDVLRAELGCRRPVEVRQSDDLVTAATIGWRRPVVLVPSDWTTWTAEQRRAVLAHEIAHARSRDFLAVLCGQFALVLHFYHPLMHWLMNRLRLEQELAADAAAASVSGGQRQYLLTIAELALHQQDRPLGWPARTFLPTRTTFLRRIAMLRDSKLHFDRLSPAARGLAAGVVVLCGLLVAGLRGPAVPSQAVAADAKVSDPALNKKVSLAPPYPESYAGAATDKISVQYAVMKLVKQAGLQYDFDASHKNTDPTCRQFIRPTICDQRCGAALEELLTPLGLTYEIHDGRIVLTRDHAAAADPALNKIVSLAAPYPQSYPGAATDKMSVQYAVMALLEQAGLRYGFDASRANTDPTCRWFVRPNIKNERCAAALETLLTPLGLSYEIHDGIVVLTRRNPASKAFGKRFGGGGQELPASIKLTEAQHKAIAEIRKLGGEVSANSADSMSITLKGIQFTDATLQLLEKFTDLQMLCIFRTSVTDAGLEHIKGLTQLRTLNLSNAAITDAGLEYLKGMTQLRALWLSWTQITDEGLKFLPEHFSKLDFLYLYETQISDAGLKHLCGLPDLRVLNLGRTLVTEGGLKTLQQALPNCRISAGGSSGRPVPPENTSKVPEEKSADQYVSVGVFSSDGATGEPMKPIAGSVVDEAGKPVAGAEVWLPLVLCQPWIDG